jgi:magnesium chelatase subunit I
MAAEPCSSATTVGALRASGWAHTPVREEMRRNLIVMLPRSDSIFLGIVGYENTVMSQIENAVLPGEDIIVLDERGQAKTRVIRALNALLDTWSPVLAECDIPENPFAPISADGIALIRAPGVVSCRTSTKSCKGRYKTEPNDYR